MSSISPTLRFGERHPVLAPVLSHLLGFAVLAGLIALDRWIFAVWLGGDYLGWYRANADRLSFTLALAALVWGDQMEAHTGLIGTSPLDQLGSYLQMLGMPLEALGTSVRPRGAIARSSPLDVLLSVPLLVAFAAAVLAWLLFVAPLQYFVQAVCGAPARVALTSGMRTIAHWGYGGRLETKEIGRAEQVPPGWWGSQLAEKPVKLTALFAALVMFALKLFHLF